jgi:hypothetical protein
MSDPITCQEAALFPAAIVHGGVVGRGVLNGLHPGLFHVALEFASVRGAHDAKFFSNTGGPITPASAVESKKFGPGHAPMIASWISEPPKPPVC